MNAKVLSEAIRSLTDEVVTPHGKNGGYAKKVQEKAEETLSMAVEGLVSGKIEPEHALAAAFVIATLLSAQAEVIAESMQ